MKKIFILITLLAGLMSACKKSEYLLYNDLKRLQFGPEPSKSYISIYEMLDSLKLQTFAYQDVDRMKDTVYFDIYTVGGTESFDRPFVLEAEGYPHQENAVDGVHYLSFSDSGLQKHYVIKADSIHARVPVVVWRHQDLQTKTLSIKFHIKENEYFKFGEPTKLWRRLEITDRLIRPTAWTSYLTNYYFGAYSRVKHEFMIQVTGKRWDNDFIKSLQDDTQTYYLAEIKRALSVYIKAHDNQPLLDENNREVTFP